MHDKIDKELLNKVHILSNETQACIIRFDSDQSASNYVQDKRLKSYEYFKCINALTVELSLSSIYKMAMRNDVVYISSTSNVCTLINVAKNIIGVPNKITSSSDFTTAIIDTGIYPHLDFMLGRHCKIVEFVDLISSKNAIYDDNGHGTMVASILTGNGIVSDTKYKGVDNNSNVIMIKALDQNGETNAINILRAMQWIYDNKAKYNIKIVCMSFGSTMLDRNDPLVLGAEALWDIGVVVVCACGNSGPEISSIKSPSASPKVISVGALDDGRVNDKYKVENFLVADFSSRGPAYGNYKPDLVVSGVDVVGAVNFGLTRKFYDKMSGTSVATPIVAGVVSRLIKKYPKHSCDQIKKILISNCHPITGDRNAEGYGWLDISKIL